MDERLAWFQCVAGASGDMLLVRWWTRAPRWPSGVLPVPVPAVVALLADAGAPVYAGHASYEMCHPTT
jgi:uncharacterized protein (DUF111 family)